MKIKITLLLALVAGLLLTEGCATRSMNTIDPASPEGIPHMVSDKRVLTDPNLNRNVYVVGINDAYTDAGYKKIQIQFYNKTRRAKSFTYRVEWFDAEGMNVGSPMEHRTPTRIEGGQIKTIVIVATSPKAVDFRVSLLESMD